MGSNLFNDLSLTHKYIEFLHPFLLLVLQVQLSKGISALKFQSITDKSVWCSFCKNSHSLSFDQFGFITPLINYRWAKRCARHPWSPEGLISSWPWSVVVSIWCHWHSSRAPKSFHPGSWFPLCSSHCCPWEGSLCLLSPGRAPGEGKTCKWGVRGPFPPCTGHKRPRPFLRFIIFNIPLSVQGLTIFPRPYF